MALAPLAPPARLLSLAVLALTLAPACGHKGPPRPPRRMTPPSLADFRLAQRGDALEVSFTTPAASVDGVPFRKLDVEIFWGEGLVNLEKAGQRRTFEARPGARVVEQLPLPAPGTLVRAAARAGSGRSRGQRSLIQALEAQAPLVPPRELGVGLREKGVTLTWKGAMPEPIAAPALPTVPDARSDPFESRPRGKGGRRPAGGPGSTTQEDSGEPGPEAAGSAPVESSAPVEAAPASSGELEEPPEAEQATPGTHGFRVYRRVDSGEWGVPLNHAPQTRRVFTDTHAPLGSTVCYVVRAVGSVDPLIESAPSNEACVEVRDIVPPGPPSGLAVVPRDGALEVVWSPSPDASLAGYRVYRAVSGAEAERVAEVPAGTTTWVDSTGEGGVLYTYTVTAVDAAGNEGPPSGSAEGIRR
jgi:hypothetical protein